jgi:hypothetical protein
MGSSDADMARQLQEQFDREEAQHQRDVTLQQPTPPPPSSSRPLTLAVVVPAGTSPGQTILVQAPSGQQVQVELPAHAVPGQTIQVSIPPQLLVQQAAQPEPEGFLGDAPGPPLPSAGAEDDDLARAIQASLGNADVPPGSSSVPPPADPFAVIGGSAAPAPQLRQEPHPSATKGDSATASIIGTSGAPLNNGAVELQLYCVDTTTSSSTLYVFAISRVGVEQPSHTVSKTYAEFVDLNDALRGELHAAASANSFLIGAAELAAALPPLPQKNTIGRRKAVVIAERQEALTQYLQAACAHPLLHDSLSLSLFLADPSTSQSGDDMASVASVAPPGQVDDQHAPPGLPGLASNVPAVVSDAPAGTAVGGAPNEGSSSSTNAGTQRTSLVMVTVPADGAPGQKLRVADPSGHEIELVIPEGVIPGQQLQVQATIPPPQQDPDAPTSHLRVNETESGTWTVRARQPHVDASGHAMYPFAVTVTSILPGLQRPSEGIGALISLNGTTPGDEENDDYQALQRSHEAVETPELASASPWDDARPQAPAVAPPVRKMSLPDEAGSRCHVGVYELCLRYSEWVALDSKLSNPPSVRNDPQVMSTLPELPSTSTVGRAKDRVMAERSKLILDYLQALCSLPTARSHPSFRTLLDTGKAAESSRQQLLGRVDALEMELAKRSMAVDTLEAENYRLSQALKEAESRLAQVKDTTVASRIL